jgi:4-amino-4-deoxy-L-arabinose transferase-like glycosyltransferase
MTLPSAGVGRQDDSVDGQDRSRSWSPSRRRVVLLLVVALALLLRGFFFVTSLADPDVRQIESDSRGYLALARSLERGEGFAREVGIEPGKPPVWLPELVRTPGYPAIIAVMHWLFGRDQLATIVVQNLVGIALCVAGALAAQRHFGPRAGLAAGVMLALDIEGAALANVILSELLYGALIFFAVLLIADGVERPRPAQMAAGGALLGLGVLVRPTTMLFGLFLTLLLLGWALLRRRRQLAIGAILLGIFANGLLVPWVIRNGRVAGEYTVTSVGRSVLIGFHATDTLARAKGISREQAAEEIESRLHLSYSYVRAYPLTAEQRSSLNRLAFQIIRENPRAFLTEWAYLTVRMLGAPDKTAFIPLGLSPDLPILEHLPTGKRSEASLPLSAWIIWVLQWPYMLLVWVLFGVGVIRAVWFRSRDPVVWLSLLVSVYVLALSSGSPGDERYRWPVLPSIVLVGASALRDNCRYFATALAD